MDINNILLLLSIAFINLIIAFFNNYRYISSSNDQLNHLIKVVDIHDIMNDIIAMSNATRMYIFTTHNGSGVPSIHKPFKVSVLYGNNYDIHTKSIYQDLNVDEEYARMLLRIKKESKTIIKPYSIEVDNEPILDESDSFLKNIYRGENIKLSSIYYITTTNHGMIYCSISTKNKNIWTNKDKSVFKKGVEELRLLYLEDLNYNGAIRKVIRYIITRVKLFFTDNLFKRKLFNKKNTKT